METDPESDDSLFNDDSQVAKKGTKSRPKKPKAKKIGEDSTDESTIKKPRYNKKKTIAQIDEQGQPIAPAVAETPSISTLTTPSAAPQITFHLQAPELPSIVQKPNGGRKKSSMNLAKLMKKNGRKKRKKTSSGEEEDEDDDSDDFEVPVKKSKGKAKAQTDLTLDEATMENESQNDEETAKALQLSENKRRSTRTNKRTKYTSEEFTKYTELNNADLIIPPTEEELAAEAAQDAANAEAANSNIVLTAAENLVIDKILGVRLFKRKTRRKKEKAVQVVIDEDARAALEDILFKIENVEREENGEEPLVSAKDSSILKEPEEEEAELSEWEDDGGEIEVRTCYFLTLETFNNTISIISLYQK